MKYAYTILYVPDVDHTLRFYELAFGFTRKFITPEKDYGELVSGETTLAFASLELGNANFSKGFTPLDRNAKPVGVELAFVTESIAEDFERAMNAGATLYEALQVKPWGQTVGYLRDCNGFLIEICTPIKSI